jgi:chromosome segregation ATPase
MVELALASINTFAPVAPAADLFQALLAELSALREEVARLQEDNQNLRERLASLESRQIATQKRVGAISDTQDEICDKINEHATALNTIWKTIKTVPKNEDPTAPTSKTTDHIDQLARIMTEDKRRSVSVATAAKLLCISKERMRQLKPLLLADSRFELGWDRQRGQRKRVIIRLRQFIK